MRESGNPGRCWIPAFFYFSQCQCSRSDLRENRLQAVARLWKSRLKTDGHCYISSASTHEKFMQMSRIKTNLTSFVYVCNAMFLKHSDDFKIFIYGYCIYTLSLQVWGLVKKGYPIRFVDFVEVRTRGFASLIFEILPPNTWPWVFIIKTS